MLSQLCEAGANVRGGKNQQTQSGGEQRRERTYPLRHVRPLYPAKTELLRMGHTMRNLAEMGLLKNRSAFICRPTPEEALKWGDSLDKLLTHKCKLLLPPLLSWYSICLWCLWCITGNRGRDWCICWSTYRCRTCRLLQQIVFFKVKSPHIPPQRTRCNLQACGSSGFP